jgi:amino acid transporter
MPDNPGEDHMQNFSLKHLLLGKPLETKELPHQAISKFVGLAVFASDALSSSAYATQEMLIILAIAGSSAAIFSISIPLSIAIAVLLAIVTISYRQTIYAYPNGGGAYIVARDNLGELPAQVAGAALLTDYILTVAVSISAGVEQITSAFQGLLPYRVEICVAVIIVMTVVNLRGVKESGRIFAVPTYFFLTMLFMSLGVGFFRYFNGTLGVVQNVEPIHYEATATLSLFLILRAFSSGCAALTGIEAISNGITAFKEPRSKNAATTLVWMSAILITLFLGITFLAHQIGAQPSHVETIISQLGRTVFGNGSVLWYLVLAGTALILLMAANTSYADFPRLAALHAGDGFLPRQLTYRGGRLVFSWGIVFLAITAIALIVVSGAITTNLIPLYAVGVFLGFTISQTGMVVRLLKVRKMKPGEKIETLETTLEHDPHWYIKIGISAVGAVCTFVVMLIFAVTKFTSGAWFIVLLIPCLVFVFFRIHHHYKDVAHLLSLDGARPEVKTRPVKTLILVDDVHAETARMVNFAKSLGHDWEAVHVGVNPEKAELVKEKWQKRIGEGQIVILESPYRMLAKPIQDYIRDIQTEIPGCFVHVIMGHLVMDTFWEQILHQNSALIFNLALSHMEQVVVTSVPFQIQRNGHDNTTIQDEAILQEASAEAFD